MRLNRSTQMADEDFTGKVAIVTGASRGIGRVIALGLARRGAALVGTARSLDASAGAGGTLKGTIEAVEQAGARGLAVPADITDEAGVRSVVDAALAEFGRIDILVNNAGVYPDALIVEHDPADWRAMLEINVTAPFLMCRAVLPVMMKQRSGNIFNVTSGAASRYNERHVGYATSKAALNTLSQHLAEEVRGYGIAVNAWGPGLVATDMNAYNPHGADASVVEESVMWAVAQMPETFTGQVVRRDGFGESWGPR
jgi:3-oxoacyl-[acyl-carrier protein] reductase